MIEKGYKTFQISENKQKLQLLKYLLLNDLFDNDTFQEEFFHPESTLLSNKNESDIRYAENLEDSLHNTHSMKGEVLIAEVEALNKNSLVTYQRDYATGNLYLTDSLVILRFLSRKKIIDMFLNMNSTVRVKNFVSSYKLTPFEISMFKNQFFNNPEILDAILYYQENDKDIYKRNFVKVNKAKNI